ncbi:MAG: filamentous hemagglutinin N-terminal domain-containing protein [Oscillatoriales cyanobacterium]|nr:MAG: filamentous hemagglutinin N-terminal domain-containing protein [Oscillatoriales cyanobacterium]
MDKRRSPYSQITQLTCQIVGGIVLAWGTVGALWGAPVRSQLVPDGSLGTIIDDQAFETTGVLSIQAGSASGTTLFHSFQEFSIPIGVTADFTALDGIDRIVSRVTGSQLSQIDGTLRSPVSLFLINPNGLIFGETAAIEVNGAFYATTADTLEFADGLTFQAQLEATSPLLSLAIPVGLGFGTIAGREGANTGTILNRSQTIGVGLDGNPTPVGLNATPTQSLGLIGGNVTIANGVATAIDGQIETIALQDGVWSLGAGSVSEGAIGGTVRLDGGVINTSGLSGGRVRLFGADIELTNGAGVYADTFGSFTGGGIVASGDRWSSFGESFLTTSNFGSGTNAGIRLDFRETIAIDGIGPYLTVGKLLSNTFSVSDRLGGLYALVANTGEGGDIQLNAPTIRLTNGTSVLTTVVGFGQGGDISIQASDTLLAAGGTFVLTSTVAPGAAGNMQIDAGTLLSVGGGVFNTSPSGELSGNGGDFAVRADRIEVRDTAAGSPIPGGILATTLGSGDAGRLTIDTGSLLLDGGGQVSVSSSGAGRGGDLTLRAGTIEIGSPTSDGRFLSGIFASSGLLTVNGTRGDASSGSIDITAQQLILRDGGQISAAIGNAGSAGDVRLNISEFIDLSGLGTNIDPSVEAVSFGVIGDGIIPTAIEANTSNTGNAGNVSIHTDRLRIRDGAEIGVRGTSTGNAGDLAIVARQIELTNNGDITVATASGQGGNATLSGERLVLRDQSFITATAGGNGDGGNLRLNFSEAIIGLDQSTILADANFGNGGQIAIQAPGLFLSLDSRLSASSNFGQSGTIAIRSPNLDPGSALVDLSTETAKPDALILDPCRTRTSNRFVLSGRGGFAATPIETYSLSYPGYRVGYRNPPLTGQAEPATPPQATQNPPHGDRAIGFQPSASPHPETIEMATAPIQEAQGFVWDTDGQVQLTIAPQEVESANPWPNAVCSIDPTTESSSGAQALGGMHQRGGLHRGIEDGHQTQVMRMDFFPILPEG